MAIPGNMMSPTTESVDPNISGWTAKLNATLGPGINGRNGPGCLAVKSVAAGETQARTVASYPVTVGTEYEAFVDASGATVPARVGIRWMTAAFAEISITWSVTASAANASFYRIATAGLAPAGATQAQVIVSAMTPAAPNVINYYENAYFGLPIRTTGNLLDFKTESLERDASGWVVDSNCTLSRVTQPTQWTVDYYLAGGHMLALQVTANGNAACRTVEQPEATAGTEYVGYCYLSPPTSGSATWVELRWYNAAFSQIGTTRGDLAAPGTGTYRQKVSAVAPVGTAHVALAAGITAGTAGQVMRIDGAVIQTASPVRAGSVVPYADSSFEAGIGGWTVVSGVAALARLTPWGTDAVEGAYSMTVTSATATTSVIRSPRYAIGAAAGLSWSAEVGAKLTAGGWTLTRTLRWYNAANADLGTSSFGPSAVPSPNWWLLTFEGTAPAGATQAAIEWTLTATAPASVLRIDQASLWQSVPIVAVGPHDADAYVTVTMRELVPGDTITLWRVTPDGQRTLVRGPDGLIEAAVLISNTLVVEDYEGPIGVAVYYYAETRSSAGVLTSTRTTDTVMLTPGDADLCWLKDPGNPRRNLQVMVVTPPDWARPIQQTVHRVKGRRNAVVHSDIRGGHEGSLVVWTRSDDEADALHWVLDSGAVLLWQVVPGVHEIDRYVSVGAVPLPRLIPNRSEDWREWTLPLIEVDMPVTVGVAGSAGRTWQDILSEFSTWADVRDAFDSWENVLFNRRKDV